MIFLILAMRTAERTPIAPAQRLVNRDPARAA
jgi:hypothetical protein